MRSNERELRLLYLAFDVIILNISFIFVYYLNLFLFTDSVLFDSREYVLLLNLSALITYTIFSRRNLYLHDSYNNRVKRITNRTIIYSIVLFVLAHLALNNNVSHVIFVSCVSLFYFGKIFFYYGLYSYLKLRRSKGYYVHKVLILGNNDMGRFLKQLIDSNPMLGYNFVGYVSVDQDDNDEVIGSLANLKKIVDDNEIDFLFVTLALYNELKKSKELLSLCNQLGIRLRFVPENQYWYKSSMNMESVGSLAVINPQEIPLDDFNSRAAKRIFDIVFSLSVILFVLSWLFPILAILIKLESKGPVFFVQKRTGINNKTFRCLKFRSMRMSVDADLKQATKEDPRITRLGAFMRKTNLDEFPQFFNVLLGQMSIVGPRPHMLKHTDQYSELIDHYKVRHYVKPGITGWAQVCGYRGETDELWKMEKRVEYDMKYLENWTFWWDLRIVTLTVLSKSAHQNAY